MKKSSIKFSYEQIKFFIVIGTILGLRELSMTMINPFISVFSKQLAYSTPLLSGIALGIYGFTNSIFQIPYGTFSDKYGRKQVMIIGLIQLSLGLFMAYLSTNIFWFIFARALQGSGAVMAIGYSWIGDTFDSKQINTAMVYAGTIVSIGAVSSFVLGPVLYLVMPLKYMFLGCAFLIFLCILGLIFCVKNNPSIEPITSKKYDMKHILTKPLIILSICGFIFNYLMSSMFYIAPGYIDELIGSASMWKIMLPAVIIGIVSMKIAAKYSEQGYFSETSSLAFIFLGTGFSFLIIKQTFCIFLGVSLIFSGYMILTTGFPSMINKIFPIEIRGSANGVLQTMIFFGFFIGPTLTGLFVELNSAFYIFFVAILLSLIGIILIVKSKIYFKDLSGKSHDSKNIIK